MVNVSKIITVKARPIKCRLKKIKFHIVLRTNCIPNIINVVMPPKVLYKNPIYIEKHNIIEDQAAPKTHPGGVQGAFSRLVYQSVCGPLAIK